MGSFHSKKLEHLFQLWDLYGCRERYLCFMDGGYCQFAIYGAGLFGKKMASALKEQFNTAPVAFIDQKAEAGAYSINGIPVCSPREVFSKYGDIPIGVAVKTYLTGEQADEINGMLRTTGFTDTINILTCDAYWNEFLYYDILDRQKAICAIDMLHDCDSKEQYYAYIYSRIWKTLFYAPVYPASTGYCATDLFTLDENDHVLDCGAYDGDTARLIMTNFPSLRHITMFEPDACNYKKLVEWSKKVNGKALNSIQKAVSNVSGSVGFLYAETIASRVNDSCGSKVDSCRIDDLELTIPPSFIKMDVEGSELEALHGAEKTIMEHKPILAISAYHKAADVYELPFYIKQLHSDYCLFYRKYSLNHVTYDFVLYAVPPERLL
jgi:FkbM family methyltransferase